MERPKKRDLIRWDEDKDILLLLAIQSHCGKRNIKIPWDEVGQEIGPKVTGNAVIQHLAKVKKRREEEGKPVPGQVLKRKAKRRNGADGISSADMRSQNSVKRSRKSGLVAPVDDLSDEDSDFEPKKRVKRLNKKFIIKTDSSDESDKTSLATTHTRKKMIPYHVKNETDEEYLAGDQRFLAYHNFDVPGNKSNDQSFTSDDFSCSENERSNPQVVRSGPKQPSKIVTLRVRFSGQRMANHGQVGNERTYQMNNANEIAMPESNWHEANAAGGSQLIYPTHAHSGTSSRSLSFGGFSQLQLQAAPNSFSLPSSLALPAEHGQAGHDALSFASSNAQTHMPYPVAGMSTQLFHYGEGTNFHYGNGDNALSRAGANHMLTAFNSASAEVTPDFRYGQLLQSAANLKQKDVGFKEGFSSLKEVEDSETDLEDHYLGDLDDIIV